MHCRVACCSYNLLWADALHMILYNNIIRALGYKVKHFFIFVVCACMNGNDQNFIKLFTDCIMIIIHA